MKVEEILSADELEALIAFLRQVDHRSRGETAEAGELAAIEARLVRVARQLKRLHPLPSDRKRHASTGAREAAAAPSRLATLRLLLDAIENRVAQVLPTDESGGGRRWKFRGRKPVTNGETIRADFNRLGMEETMRKWCLDGKLGVAGGRGEYTKRQVQAVLAHESGGHRRRRRLTGPVAIPQDQRKP